MLSVTPSSNLPLLSEPGGMDGGSYGVIKDAASPRTHADTLQPSKCDKMFIRVKLIIVLVL